MDGCTRHAAFCSYVLERNTGILGKDAENLSVKIVYFLHFFSIIMFYFKVFLYTR